MAFLHECFSCRGVKVAESYGTTEIGAIAQDGVIVDAVECKLMPVPDLGYLPTDDPPRGEVWVRLKHKSGSEPVAYWGTESADRNRDIFDADGWYRTGDIAVLTAGQYRIIDRRRDLFKHSHGEFVSPARVEGILTSLPDIDGAFVTCDSDQTTLVLVAVVKDAAKANGEDLQRQIASSAVSLGLETWEVPSLVLVVSEPFSLTASGKLARQTLAGRFGGAIDELVRRHRQSAGAGAPEVAVLECIVAGVESRSTSDRSFAEFGLDSLSVARFLRLFEDRFGPSYSLKPRTLFHPMLRIHHITEALAAAMSSVDLGLAVDFDSEVMRMAVKESESTQFWEREASLDGLDLDLDGGCSDSGSDSGNAVFITGATGFLGRWLLHELAKTGSYPHIFALVRCSDSIVDGVDRLRSAYESVFFAHDSDLDFRSIAEYDGDGDGDGDTSASVSAKVNTCRVWVVAGDCSKPRLGLADRWSLVAMCCDKIVHCAARVNHMLPYDALRAANVASVVECLKLALEMKKNNKSAAVCLHFISSTAAVGAAAMSASAPLVVDESYATPTAAVDRLSAYGQSKWVGERLLQKAAAQDQLHVVIHRPGLIGCPCSDPSVVDYNQGDWVTLFVQSSIEAGACPDLDNTLAFSAAPVDYVAAGISWCVQRQNGSDGGARVLHWVNQDACKAAMLSERMSLKLKLKLTLKPYDEWVSLLPGAAVPLFGKQFPSSSSSRMPIDDDATRRLCPRDVAAKCVSSEMQVDALVKAIALQGRRR